MPLPAGWTLITVTATYTQRDGDPAVGRVVFTAPQVVVVDGEIIVPRAVVGTLNASGELSVQLPSTDDPDIAPTGWTWTVREYVRGLSRDPWAIEVPYDGGPIDLATVSPAVPVDEVSTLLTQAAADARYLLLAGGTMTGALVADSPLTIDDGTTPKLGMTVNGTERAYFQTDNSGNTRIDSDGQLILATNNTTRITIAAGGSVTGIGKSDVGLGNVDNTSDAAKPVSTATQTALDAKQGLDSDLTAIAALTPSNDDVVQRKAGAWTNRTMAQVKTDLVLVKGDVGLGNVDNTSDANKPVSTATQTALDLKANLASPTFTGTPAAPTAAAGTNTTQVATTAHVMAVAERSDYLSPPDYNLIAWNIPWWQSGTGTILATAGLLHVCKLHVPKAATITNVEFHLSAAGSSLTSGQNFAALFSGAKALLSTTADQTTAWGSTGRKTMALSAPQAVAAGFVYVGFFSNGSTLPTPLRSSGQSMINGGLAAADSFWATADTGRTTSMPSTIGTMTALSVSYAVGVS